MNVHYFCNGELIATNNQLAVPVEGSTIRLDSDVFNVAHVLHDIGTNEVEVILCRI